MSDLEDDVSDANPPSTAITIKGKDGAMQTFDYGAYTGQGSEMAHEGSRVPFLSVLQPLSKACLPGDDKYVQGAQAGMLLLDGEVIDGKTGVLFIGIEEQHTFIEITSLKGDGEIKGEHAPNSEEIRTARGTYGTNKSKWRSKAGHFLVERFNMYGVVFRSEEDLLALKGTAAIVGFERTKLKARDAIMSPFRKCSPAPPLFAAILRLGTVMEKNKANQSYFNLKPVFYKDNDFLSSLIHPVQQKEFWDRWAPQASKIAKMVKAGQIKGDEKSAAAGGVGGDDDGPEIPF